MSSTDKDKNSCTLPDCVKMAIDIGGTNTDAVHVKSNKIISVVKNTTTADVTPGIITAIKTRLKKSNNGVFSSANPTHEIEAFDILSELIRTYSFIARHR